MLQPWLLPAFDTVVQAFRTGQLGHAQLLHGPQYLGKDALAQALAQRLLCQRHESQGLACGECTACQRFVQGSHGDFRRIGIELNERTGKPKTAIGVDQIRAMSEWLTLTAQLSGPRVVIIETAHRMNVQASNALLKTLEEPMPGRYLFLVTDQPKALPATVRSRCQRIAIAPPGHDSALAWVKGQGLKPDAAETLLALAGHNPGLAVHWAQMDGIAVHQQVRKDLEACMKGQSSTADIAKQWLADEQTELRLLFCAQIGHGLSLKWAKASSQGQQKPQSVQKLQEWIDGINRLRLSLSQPLRHDLGLAGLLFDWRQLLQEFR